MSPEDLGQLLAAMNAGPAPSGSSRSSTTRRGSLFRKFLYAVLVAAIGIGASFASCIGQSFSLRQARALESIETQLQGLRTDLATGRRFEGH